MSDIAVLSGQRSTPQFRNYITTARKQNVSNHGHCGWQLLDAAMFCSVDSKKAKAILSSKRHNHNVGIICHLQSGVKSTHLRTLAQKTDSLTTHHHQEELGGGGQPWELPLGFKSEKGS